MGYETIIYEKKEAVAKIILNRPEARNAMTGTTFMEMGQALDDAEKDDNIRVVVIKGNGKAFCSGVDLKFSQEQLKTLQDQEKFFRFANNAVLEKMESMSKPVIAQVHGYCLAGGFEMMLAVDIVVAAEDARIGDQHINVGLYGAGGSPYRLPLLIGMRRAKDLLLAGRLLTGKEAEQVGLVNRAVPADELESAVDALAADMAGKGPLAMRLTKDYVNRAVQIDYTSRLEHSLMSCLVLNSSEDYQEAMNAFNEKRKPVFKGR
jgi:enoyl-CoA hydratase/carnithine racemase